MQSYRRVPGAAGHHAQATGGEPGTTSASARRRQLKQLGSLDAQLAALAAETVAKFRDTYEE